jgi:hypothetical protein
VLARERGGETVLTVGNRRRRGEEDAADRRRAVCLAPRLEHHVEWSHDRLQLVRVLHRRQRAMASRPGDESGRFAPARPADHGGAALECGTQLHRARESIEDGFTRQGRGGRAALREAPRLVERVAKIILEGS